MSSQNPARGHSVPQGSLPQGGQMAHPQSFQAYYQYPVVPLSPMYPYPVYATSTPVPWHPHQDTQQGYPIANPDYMQLNRPQGFASPQIGGPYVQNQASHQPVQTYRSRMPELGQGDVRKSLSGMSAFNQSATNDKAAALQVQLNDARLEIHKFQIRLGESTRLRLQAEKELQTTKQRLEDMQVELQELRVLYELESAELARYKRQR
ncbi:MAG: hypothetical protein LQ351_003579 [Letrouitia transgressa]|nr:MAG: hypothetical protein LQ351_003579 [Letrouitia transgressa]